MRRLVFSVLIVAACTDAVRPTSPDLSLLVVSGDGQTGPVGTQLPLALVVQAVDARGRPMRKLDVRWQVTSGGGQPATAMNKTDQNGKTFNYWTLGTASSEAQRLEARVASTNELLGAFTATAVPGPAAQLAVSAGDGQTAVHGTNVPVRPAVRVSDQYGNPTSGISVIFAVTGGGGSATGTTQSPDASGIATVGSWTLGPDPGANALTASASGLSGSPVTFTATGVLGPVSATQSSVSASPETLAAGASATITATIRDAGGYPIGGVTVVLATTGSGSTVTQPAAVTNSAGVAIGALSATVPGPKTVSASADGVSIAQTASVIVTAGPAAAMTAHAGDNQAAPAGTAVPVSPAVRLTDAYGNPVAGVAVTFAVTTGGGTVAGTTPVSTSSQGIAAVGGWTLGPLAGTNTLSATAEGTDISGNPATFTAQAIGDVWTSAAPLSGARTSLAAATIDGRVYAVGGSGFSDARRLEVYDPATNSWTTKAPMPTRHASPGVGVINDILYVVGGWSGGVSDTVESYDPVTDTWTTRAPLPTRRYGMAVAVADGVLYVIGGYTGTLVCELNCGWVITFSTAVEAYDPATDSWSTKASLPAPRAAHAATELNGLIYAVGGKSDFNNSWLATMDAYDAATDTWTPRASMPTGRFGLGAGAVGGRLYAVGGEVAPNTLISTVEAYDPATDTWTTRAPLPRNREWFGTAVAQGLLYVVGGMSYFDEPNKWCICQVELVDVYHHP